jgi:menaquinone-9 beta-reductase
MISPTTTVCIIGAGPGGTTTALFLAKLKIPHILIDKDVFPRDKICGDGLDLKVMRVLHHLDPTITPEIVFDKQDYSQSWGIRAISPNGTYNDFVQVPKEGEPYCPIFCTSKRINFDNFLVKKLDTAYTEAHFGAKATNIVRKNGGIEVTIEKEGKTYTTFCNLIVGADGDHSIVLRKLDERKIDRRHYAAGLRQYWRGVTGFHEKKLIEIYLKKEYPLGYFWMFPLPNNEANVGFGMLSEMVSKNKVNLKECMQDITQNDPYLSPRFKSAEPLEEMQGWGLPLASRRKKAFGDNYLLVGDAASAINPVTGEGIGTAMMSGYVAAQFIEKAVKMKAYNADTFKNYDSELYRRVESEVKAFNLAATLKSEKWINPFMNTVVYTSLWRYAFERSHQSWLKTAFNTPIRVKT